MTVGLVRSVLLLGSFLCLQKPAFSGYEAINPPNSIVSYNLNNISVRTFPDEANISREDYRYFFNEFNFNINSRLLTGAADELYLFDLDLNMLGNYTWEPDRSVVALCNRTNDNSTYTCRNHIRTFKQLPSNQNQILVCGTQADTTPQCRIVELSGDVFGRGFTAGPASNGLLSYYPEYTSFGEFLAASSSDERFFSAALGSTDRDFRISFSNVTLSDPANPSTLQTAELFKTLTLDRWLDFPVTFVDYFRADYQPVAPATLPEHYQFYFVFLRESLTNADVIYSRVARICRNDPGLTSSMGLGNQFTTFMKARIFCEREVPPGRQFAGTVDFQYNEIKSMVFNEEGRYAQTTDWVKLMYGAFTGPSIGPVGTAICVYKAYNGVELGESGFNRGIFDIFREDLQNAQGGEVESMYVECEPGGRSESESELIQVVQDVSQIGENPLLVLDGLIVTQMAVDQVCVVRSDGTGCVNQDILFLGTDTGKMLKVVFVSTGLMADPIAPVVAEEITLDDDNAVNQLNIQQADDGIKYIYASTFSKIYRLPLERCGRHNNPNNVTDSCRSCISVRDPYCVWNVTYHMCESNPLIAQTSSTNTAISNYLQNVHTDVIPPECTFPEIGFISSSDSISERETSYTVTIRSSVAGATSNGLVDIYTLQRGNATAGMDYADVSGDPITFAPGSTETTYTITLLPDDTFEGGNEQVVVSLRAIDVPGAEPVVISQGQFTLNIIEDDSVSLRLDSAEISVSEGANSVNVTITRIGSTTVDTRVILNTVQNGTAVADEDYFPVVTEVTFSLSESVRTVTIPLINDNVQETREWFVVELVLPADQVGTFLGAPVVTNITILDDDPVMIRFSDKATMVTESDGVVVLTLVKDGQTMIDYELEITLTPGSAGTSDYISPTQSSITFPAGADRMTVPIMLVDDRILEDQESFSAELRVASGSLQEGVIADGNITITIIDDDSTTVGVSSTDYSVSESGGSVSLDVVLGAETETEVVVELITISGTATADDDFRPESSLVTFGPGGSTSLPVMFQILDDNVLEATEYFTVQLISYFSRVSVQQGRANVTITDDDSTTVRLSSTDYSTSEGDGSVVIGIMLGAETETEVAVELIAIAGTATADDDFRPESILVTFLPGGSTSLPVMIQILDNDVLEATEYFTVQLSSSRVSVQQGRANVTITDDDAVTVGFAAAEYMVSEMDGSVAVAIRLLGLTDIPLTFFLSTADGTDPETAAASGEDYVSVVMMPVNFIPSLSVVTQITVNFQLINDDTVENSEQFQIVLESLDGVNVDRNTTIITIQDNDFVEFGFETTSYSTSESGGVVEVGVIKYGSSTLPLSVSLSTMSGSATSPQDFTPISGQELTFSPAQSRQTVNINIMNDGIFEDSEEFTVLLMPVSLQSRILMNSSNTATVQISDDDTLIVGFSPTQYTILEGAGAVVLNVGVNGRFQTESVVLQASLADGTATSGADFNYLIPSTLEFRAGGDTSAQVTVTIVDDNIVESLQEEFSIQLSSTNPRVIVQQSMANVIITDDDVVEFGFETAGYSTSESVAVVEVGVVKYGSSSLPLSVNLSTMSGSATSTEDFTPINGQVLTFSPAESRQTVNVNIADDAVLENVEQFSVVLTQINNSQAQVVDVLNSTTVTISDNDRVSVNLSSTEYMISEGAGMISVGVSFGVLQSQVIVGLSTIPGTASEETDFMSQTVMLTFSSSGSQTVMIQLLDDTVLEDREYFTLQLFSTDSRVDLQQSTATVWIMDDDSVSIGYGSPAYTASEMDCFISVNIRLLSGSADVPLNFYLTTTSGKALAGQDFVSVSRMSVTLDPGSAVSEANVQLLDDNVVEKDPESFTLLLEPGEDLPQGVTINNNTTTINIEDDDSFTTQSPETSAPPTTSPGVVNERTTNNIVPVGPGSLRNQCIYDSFNTSVAVLAALLAIIVLLLLLLLICCCVLVKKVKEGKILKKYDPDFSSVSGSKRTSPDRFPLENFGVPNKVYRENSNSEPNTPSVKHMENEFGDTPAKVILNSNNNGNVEGMWQPGLEDSSGSSEDLTMTKL